MRSNVMDPNQWLETYKTGNVLGVTGFLCGLAGITAYITKHGKFPPFAVFVSTFAGTALLGTVICLASWQRWADSPAVGVCISLMAGLGGTESIKFVLTIVRKVVSEAAGAKNDKD